VILSDIPQSQYLKALFEKSALLFKHLLRGVWVLNAKEVMIRRILTQQKLRDALDLVHNRLIAHWKIPRSQFSDGKWTSGNGYSWRGIFSRFLASKMSKGMTRILFETGMPFVYVASETVSTS